MSLGGRTWLAHSAATLPLSLSACMDRFDTDKQQREILRSHYAEVDCGDAHLKVIEREDAIQDWRYVVRIYGSEKCLKSLRLALIRRGYVEEPKTEIASVHGLQPPKQDTEHEAVAFDFNREPGAIYWTRDKT